MLERLENCLALWGVHALDPTELSFSGFSTSPSVLLHVLDLVGVILFDSFSSLLGLPVFLLCQFFIELY